MVGEREIVPTAIWEDHLHLTSESSATSDVILQQRCLRSNKPVVFSKP
jgi:hypothetical protein